MDNAGYVSLARQTGLMRELSSIANNIANVNTTGYRKESVLFGEHVKALGADEPSLSMATMDRRFVDFTPGDIKETGRTLDFAIEGDGFFLVQTPQGTGLTRAGSFSLNDVGELITTSGQRVLDEGGGAIVIPPEARTISVSPDGAISADGQQVARLGVVTANEAGLERVGDNAFLATGGYQTATTARVHQGALEGSNVSAVNEIAKLIEVQRTYEMGQKLLSDDDQRIVRTVRELGQTG